MQSMLCARPAVCILSLRTFPSVKEQPSIYLITQPTGHYFKGGFFVNIYVINRV